MNSQAKTGVTIGDVWEDITKNKSSYTRTKDKDNIICRLTKTRSKIEKTVMCLQIGIEICDLMGWKKNDHMMIFKNKISGTLLKITKSTDNGYKLSEPNKNPCRLNLHMTIEANKKHIMGATKIVHFDMDKNFIIVDYSALLKD